MRLIDSDLQSPAYTAAADEAILIARNEGIVPNTLHFYRRDVPTISLGHFQKVEECVDLAKAKEKEVRLIRRMSGGSTIYTDPGQIIYSLTVHRSDLPSSPAEAFRIVCRGILEALSLLGLDGEFEPVNDVLIGGRKISGSAQLRRGNVIAQHGTILVDTDLTLMSDVLRSRKRTADGMTALAKEMEYVPSMDVVKGALVKGFSRALDESITPGSMTEREETLVADLIRNKYGTSRHTFLR
ncbi:MAG: lipoate--protein ligase family protein [Euryarchaeota archaeon]|nr:lipoate--protein ligase family protein [Euryarchaeota archaeon]